MINLELKIPPPLVMLTTAGAMWLNSKFCADGFATGILPFSLRLTIFVLLAFIGSVVALLGVIQFKRYQTTLNPMHADKASSLVSTGIFAYTRNPMYLGMVFALCGFVVFLGQWLLIVWVAFFVAYITAFQIKPEERILHQKFAPEFEEYKKSVRRWI